MDVSCHGNTGSGDQAAPTELTEWPPADAAVVDIEGLYQDLAGRGYDYGPAFQGVRAVWRRGEEVFAEVALPEQCRGDAGLFVLHPTLLDAALHAVGLGVLTWSVDQVWLPFSWQGVTVRATGASALRVCLTAGGSQSVSLVVADHSGQPVASVDSLVMRPVSPEQLSLSARAHQDWLFYVEWVALPSVVTSARNPGRWAVVGADPFELGTVLESGGAGGVYPDLAALAEVVKAGEFVPELVFVSCVPGIALGGTPAAVGLVETAHAGVHEVLELVRAWLGEECFGSSRLVFVTCGAMGVGGRCAGSWAAAVWGLVRSAQSENPDRFVLVDVAKEGVAASVLEVVLVSGESQVVVRADGVRVPRLARLASNGTLLPPMGSGAWRLDVTSRGTLENLALLPCPEATTVLAMGQVRVEVRAAGVNFRDVLIALGMYPGEASTGSEGAGIVVEVGPGVTGLAPGDRVMGLFSGGFGPVAVTDHRLLVGMPAGWSFVEAAAVPAAFLTAYYGLEDLAGLGRGSLYSFMRLQVVWGWLLCSWLGIGVRRYSRPPAKASGIPCGHWA